jgi:hypothetical protein
MHRQRALLRVALTTVIVGPVKVMGRNKFDPDRVSYDWRV